MRTTLQSWCLMCMKDAGEKSRIKNREKINEKARLYYTNKTKHSITEQYKLRKKVASEKFRKRNPDYQRRYDNTEKQISSSLFNGMKQKSKRRGHPAPNFTLIQFRNWLDMNSFSSIRAAYIESGADKWLRPSVDRIDNAMPYSFDNMRLVTWRENLDSWNNGGNKEHGKKSARYLLTYMGQEATPV